MIQVISIFLIVPLLCTFNWEVMKRRIFIFIILLFSSVSLFESCGPVIISSRPEIPPPPWFYPNRVETVRYVYFPEYMIYYDLSLRNYIYLNNGVWVTVDVLPPRFSTINLRRSKFVHIKDYHGDNISRYHRENQTNRGRSNAERNTRDRGN
jgi:hypothetical protein